MSKNLRQEMRSRIFDAQREHMDKYRDRAAGKTAGKIYSYGRRNALLDTANDLCAYCKDRGVRHLDGITDDLVLAYLQDKAASCTQTTVDEYTGRIHKIAEICSLHIGKIPKVRAERRSDATRGAESVISRADLQKILAYAKSHPSASGTLLQLEALIGVRVGDLCYGVQIYQDKHMLLIHGKNGRLCSRQITPEIQAVLDSDMMRSMLDPAPSGSYKLRGVKDASLNTYLRRVEDRLGLDRHSLHDIRRRIAQDKYDSYRSDGMSRSEALSAVSRWLSHGSKRNTMMLRSYIADDW